MAFLVSQIEGQVLRLLQKSASTPGFYTPAKIQDAVQDSVDYVAARMFRSTDGGWMDSMRYLDTVSGQTVVALPEDIAAIKAVRYLVGTEYVPLHYQNDYEESQWASTSGVVAYPSKYRLVGSQLYFNPCISIAGPQNLQIEYSAYPAAIQSDGMMPPQFDRAICNFIKFRSASLLAASIGKAVPEWAKFETQWATEIEIIIDKRVQKTTYITPFEG